MESQKRMLIAIALSMAIFVGWQVLGPKPPVVDEVDGGAPSSITVTQPATAPGATANSASTGASAAALGSTAPGSTETPRPEHREIHVDRPNVHYVFSSDGAGLTSAVLQGEKMRVQRPVSFQEGWKALFGTKLPEAPQADLAVPALGAPLPLAVALTGAAPFDAKAAYAVTGTPEDKKLVFTAEQGGWRVTKTFRWAENGFELAMQLNVENLSKDARTGELLLYQIRAVEPGLEQAPSMFGSSGNQSQPSCYVEEKYKQQRPTDKPAEVFPGKVNFFGVDQQYFLSAVYPLTGPLTGRCSLHATEPVREATLALPLSLAPGQSFHQDFGVYTGPRDTQILSLAPQGALAALGQPLNLAPELQPHLDKSVDYGFWAVICQVMLTILKFFHRYVPNWGISIILLTVFVKLLLLPLTHRMMIGQQAMKALQPKIDAIKAKFPNDRERVQAETMKLYQQEKVNPAGSCLLLVVQMPVWISLFTTLRNSYEIYREPFFGTLWTDLTYKDPTYVLPILLGISQIISTRLQPQPGMDPAQARIMNWVMPVVFTALLLNYPMGLTLYIFTNNVLSVAQTYGLRKWLDSRSAKSSTLVARS